MHRRYPVRWLFTDERADPIAAARRLPPGSGIVFRHKATSRAERLALFLALRRIATARRLLIVSAGGPRFSAAGSHGERRALTWPAHDRRQAIAARRAGAALVFVSPVHPTRSHPGAPALGQMRAATIARGLGMQVIALGGMDERRWRRIARLGFHGWAGIDAWS